MSVWRCCECGPSIYTGWFSLIHQISIQGTHISNGVACRLVYTRINNWYLQTGISMLLLQHHFEINNLITVKCVHFVGVGIYHSIYMEISPASSPAHPVWMMRVNYADSRGETRATRANISIASRVKTAYCKAFTLQVAACIGFTSVSFHGKETWWV